MEEYCMYIKTKACPLCRLTVQPTACLLAYAFLHTQDCNRSQLADRQFPVSQGKKDEQLIRLVMSFGCHTKLTSVTLLFHCVKVCPCLQGVDYHKLVATFTSLPMAHARLTSELSDPAAMGIMVDLKLALW